MASTFSIAWLLIAAGVAVLVIVLILVVRIMSRDEV